MRAIQTREFLESLGGAEAIGPIGAALVERLTTCTMLLTRLEDELASGKPIDKAEYTSLAYLAQSLTRTLIAAQAARKAMNTLSVVGRELSISEETLDAARQRMLRARAAREYACNVIDVSRLPAPALDPDSSVESGDDRATPDALTH